MKMWQFVTFRGNFVEARVDFRRMASSHLLELPSAYKYPRRGPERGVEQRELGFLLFSVG